MEKMEIKEYLQELLDKWNKYDELDGFTADSFRNDLEKLLEYWDLRIADNKEELDKAREEGRREGSEITSRYISDFVISESGKEVDISDTQRYKMCGNGCVTNCVAYIYNLIIKGFS